MQNLFNQENEFNWVQQSTFEFDSEKDGLADGHPYDWGHFLNNLNFIFFKTIIEVCHGKVRYLSIDCILYEMLCPRILKMCVILSRMWVSLTKLLAKVRIGFEPGWNYLNLLYIKMSLTAIVSERDNISNSAFFYFHGSFRGSIDFTIEASVNQCPTKTWNRKYS